MLFFYFLPISQCDTSFRSSPSASASVDHKLPFDYCDIKTKTKTRTMTTTATNTTKTNTCNKSTTTKTTHTSGTMADNFIFSVSAESEEETAYLEAPPRTTSLGTEMIYYRSEEAESGIDVMSAFPPSANVEVAGVCRRRPSCGRASARQRTIARGRHRRKRRSRLSASRISRREGRENPGRTGGKIPRR